MAFMSTGTNTAFLAGRDNNPFFFSSLRQV